ncbi:MAG: SDR family oxidoreductase [Desulfatibacillaceae bacterium]|nr:SDR family oxidoreductase [Desulfatibacillaceae bacterium]
MSKFKNATAIVTGGGSGIGRALAMALAKEKARVVITDLVPERVEAVKKELANAGCQAGGFVVDHADSQATELFFQRFSADWGHADILCLNAGIAIAGRIEEMELAQWRRIVDVNLFGVVNMLHFFAPGMIARKDGSILVTASGAGLFALPGLSAYCATKFALVGLCESLRMELGKHNIKVCALCPGVINTQIVSDGIVHHSDDSGKSRKGKVADFYRKQGTDPAVVARHALKGLARNQGVIPTPAHVLPGYYLRRLAPSLYAAGGRLVWKKGWLL